jgi:hypothetical protein
MFEKLSGFFKQFTSRKKRQSGETTIMPSKEGGGDEFGLDDEFGGIDTFGDTGGSETAGELDLDTFGDPGETDESADFGVTGDFPETSGLADTAGFADSGAPGGDVSAQTGAEGSVEEAFSDFDITHDGPDISTGGTDFDERTLSDEISGATEAELDDTGGDFGGAFDVGEEAAPFDAGAPQEKASSALKTIRTFVIAAVLAVGAGAAFQILAWPKVSELVGLADAGEVKVDPEILLEEEGRKKKGLTNELGAFKKVGTPAQVETLKTEIAQSRDAQGTMEEVENGFTAVTAKETEYDALKKRISSLESETRGTSGDIENVKAEIVSAKQRVVELARQTDEEYERFRFELARAELGQRLLIELQLRDIASFRTEVARLEERLTKLSAQALTVASVDSALPKEPAVVETSEN